MRLLSVLPTIALFALSLASTAAAQQTEPFPEANSEGVTASRNDSSIFLKIEDSSLKTVNIPRVSAALRSASWKNAETSNITVRPEQEYWIVKWSNKPENADTIVFKFGSAPLLPSETRPITSQTDGCYFLHAHFATAIGEKIRYEPQSHKNTVGYWVGKEDHAFWKLKVEDAGKFNVAILQGCGNGQGGSDALISFHKEGTEDNYTSLEFKVQETGHFQNFQWRTLGEIELDAGLQTLKIAPTKIAKNALMDVRAIHLVRLPAAKK